MLQVIKMTQEILGVKEYAGMKESRMDYERAKQNAPLLKSEIIEPFEQMLRTHYANATGFDEYSLPFAITKIGLSLGDGIGFDLRGETRTKKPAYKEIVKDMEGYIEGINFLLSRGRTITGVMKHNNKPFVNVEKLRDDYDVKVAAHISPEFKFTIDYRFQPDETSSILVPTRMGLDARTAVLYANAVSMYDSMARLQKSFEQDSNDEQFAMGEPVRVTKKKAYDASEKTREGPRWSYVVQTLVTVPVKNAPTGELDDLLNAEGSIHKLRRDFSQYKLMEHPDRAEVFVSLKSVYDRIQGLKNSDSVSATVISVAQQEVLPENQ